MTPRMRLAVGILFLFLGAIQSQRGASPPPDPDKDPQMQSLLQEARKLGAQKELEYVRDLRAKTKSR